MLALVDPSLSNNAPLLHRLDAVTQVLESCLWRKAVPFPNALCHVSFASGVVLPSGR